LLADVYADLPEHRWLLIGDPATAAWLVRVALAAGDHGRAAAVTAVADDLAYENPAFPVITAAADHARGILEQDLACLEHAAGGHTDPWARASAAEDLGVVLTAKNDLRGAIDRLEQGLDGYERTGATRDAARVRRRLRKLGVRRRHWASAQRPITGWASLTDTERITSVLVSQGLTNRQVADQMFVSVHTVAFHLRQVFRKLGIGSRVELTRVAMEQGRDPAPG
jgi:DNA-binding CsgD family transcriptional regulator